jgi:peptidoglycan/LPS O-acetylase OafA/YrhL
MGEHAVQVFFILSGVLVAQSFDRSRNIADFALARGLRIFPALIVCVLISAFVLGPIMTKLPLADYLTSPALATYIVKTIGLISAALPLPGVFDDLALAGLVNSSLWTLKYEVMCYAGLGLAGLAGLFAPRWRGWATLIVALFVALIFIEEPMSDDRAYSSLENIRYFSVFFFTGVLAYLVRDRLVLSFWLLLPLAAAFYFARGTVVFEVVTALFLAYGTLWASTLSFGPLRAFCNRFDLSFGIYIYAGPVQQMLLDFHPGMQPVAIAVVAFIITLPLALLSWVLIEHPALKLRRPIFDRLMRRQATAAGSA